MHAHTNTAQKEDMCVHRKVETEIENERERGSVIQGEGGREKKRER